MSTEKQRQLTPKFTSTVINQHLTSLFNMKDNYQSEIKLLLFIIENILNNRNKAKFKILNIDKTSKKFTNCPICIQLLLEAGFKLSDDGKQYIFDDTHIYTLQQIYNFIKQQQTTNNNLKQDNTASKSTIKKNKNKSLRTSLDVYNRLLWDKTLPFDTNNVVIGYNDAMGNCITEINFKDWIPIDKGGDIPMHHIIYFALIINNNDNKLILWDKRIKLDRLFGSGNTKRSEKFRNVLPMIKNANTTKDNSKHDEKLLSMFNEMKLDETCDENVVLLMCGSFFPIHKNHIFLLQEAKRYLLACKNIKYNVVCGIITVTNFNALMKKCNGNKNKIQKIADYRVKMCELATRDINWIIIDSWLCNQDTNVGAARSKQHLKQLLAKHFGTNKLKLISVIGDDNICKFKNAVIYGSVLCVVNRNNIQDIKRFEQCDDIQKYKHNLIICNANMNNIPAIDCSSTKIRNIFRNGVNKTNENYLKQVLDLTVIKFHKTNKISYREFSDKINSKYSENKADKCKMIMENNIKLFKTMNINAITNLNEFEIEEKYQYNKIGKGRQGGIQPIYWVKKQCKYALKSYEMLKNYSSQFKGYKNELKTLLSLSKDGGHNNIIKMFGCGYTNKSCFFVLEYIDFSMREFIEKDFEKWYNIDVVNKRVNIPLYWFYAFSKLANGCHYLNNVMGIMHRDFTISNLMIRVNNYGLDKFEIIIIDFGCSIQIENANKIRRGSTRHYAPESIGNNNIYEYNTKSEVFSFGNILWEFIHKGEIIFSNIKQTHKVWKYILNGQLPKFKIKCNELFENLVKLCWIFEPKSRPSFHEIEQKLIQMM